MIDARTSAILQALYGAALDPDLWQQALRDVADCVGACAGVMEFVAYGDGRWHAAGGFGYDLEAFQTNPDLVDWPEHDPWAHCVEREPDSELILGSKYVSADEVRNSSFRNDYLRPIGADWRDVLAVVPNVGTGALGVFALYRAADSENFGYRELAQLEALKPHIINALKINARFENLSALTSAQQHVLDDRSEALLVLNRSGGVVFCNRAAEAHFTGDWPVLVLRRGQLQLADEAANANFQLMLSRHLSPAAGPFSGGPAQSSMVWHDARNWRPYSLCITPNLPALAGEQFTAADSGAAVAVSISDFRVDAPRIAARMQQAYALTDAETSVLSQLIDRARPADICAANGVSMNTVRAQLKAIFRKTGVATQAELISRAMAGFRS